MKIDIDRLSLEELVDLNHRIVERLKFMESMHHHAEMMKFSIGEKVTFEPRGASQADWHIGQVQQEVGYSDHRFRAEMDGCSRTDLKGQQQETAEGWPGQYSRTCSAEMKPHTKSSSRKKMIVSCLLEVVQTAFHHAFATDERRSVPKPQS
jgi:hypothetical protein